MRHISSSLLRAVSWTLPSSDSIVAEIFSDGLHASVRMCATQRRLRHYWQGVTAVTLMTAAIPATIVFAQEMLAGDHAAVE